MKKNGKLKTFLMQKFFEKKFNIGSNKLARMKTKNNMILLDLMIFWKLLRIFIFVILISCNLNQKISRDKIIKLRQNIYSKNFVSKKRSNVMIYSLFLAYHIFLRVVTAFVSYLKFCLVKLS